jgi:hypothetical protein
MTDYWEATAADYFDRVSSAYIIGAVTEACGKGRGRKAQRHEERQHGEGSRTVSEREGVATGSAAGRKVSQPVEPIARPWKIDPVSFARGHSWPHGDRLCAWRSGGQEYANAAVIVLAVNAHDHLVTALKAISTHWANQYGTWRLPCIRGYTGPASQTATERARL